MARIDFHVHTSASFDCQVAPDALGRRCRRLGLNPIVVTDHDTIAGAIELRRQGFEVVIGEEIATSDGELIGLFLDYAVPAGLSARETVLRIKDQGGLIYLEHPYDRRRRSLSEEAVASLALDIDIVEIFNGRADEDANRRAEDLALTLGVPVAAGSDSHTLAEVGTAYVQLRGFSSPGELLEALDTAKIVTGAWPWTLAIDAFLRGTPL